MIGKTFSYDRENCLIRQFFDAYRKVLRRYMMLIISSVFVNFWCVSRARYRYLVLSLSSTFLKQLGMGCPLLYGGFVQGSCVLCEKIRADRKDCSLLWNFGFRVYGDKHVFRTALVSAEIRPQISALGAIRGLPIPALHDFTPYINAPFIYIWRK